MPIKIPENIPAYKALKEKDIFVMSKNKAEHQNIRPLRIGILNLMPTKITTETQILRMISWSPLQIDPILIKTSSYTPKNTSSSHLEEFYLNFDEVKKQGLDWLIITWTPVEKLEFEDVAYWEELKEIMTWADKNITSTMFLCWGAQAGLNHFYWIPKYLTEHVFWAFKHNHNSNNQLLRWIDDEFIVCHARHTKVKKEDIEKIPELEILSESEDAGLHLITNKNSSQVYVIWHPEYDRNTLSFEYFRDQKQWLNPNIPKNYFPNDDDTQVPKMNWRANAEMFYRNWINLVYQKTPYELKSTN